MPYPWFYYYYYYYFFWQLWQRFCCGCCFVFQAILSDLFPGKEIPDHDYGKLQATIEECLLKKGCQVSRSFSLDSVSTSDICDEIRPSHGLRQFVRFEFRLNSSTVMSVGEMLHWKAGGSTDSSSFFTQFCGICRCLNFDKFRDTAPSSVISFINHVL